MLIYDKSHSLFDKLQTKVPSSSILMNLYTVVYRLDSSVGRASAFGAGGRGFESRGRTIPKVQKMVLAAPLLTLA